jgi:hypothetical protein
MDKLFIFHTNSFKKAKWEPGFEVERSRREIEKNNKKMFITAFATSK